MSSRGDFLKDLFRSLDAGGIPYCVLRNYDHIFADTTTDVDMLVAKRNLLRFKEILRAAADRTGHRYVHRARYVNYSYVFWHARDGFVRIDFETELRWRVFPVLSAQSVLHARQPGDGFFIPHPRHESVILFLQGIWRRSLSERYRNQLARLYHACTEKEELQAAYREAFGGAGAELADLQAHIKEREFTHSLCARLKRSLIRKSLSRPGWLRALAANISDDVHRLWDRLRKPAGLSLVYASSAAQDKRFDDLVHRIEFLCPAQKCLVEQVDLRQAKSVSLGLEPGRKIRRLRTLLKGGLFVRYYRVSRDTDLARVVQSHPRLLYPSRAFFCMEDSRQRTCLGHIRSGFMTDSSAVHGPNGAEFSSLFIEFIASVLEKDRRPRHPASGSRGVFAVLIGLDGSGKTTLARNLARLAAGAPRFRGVRYFHWRPKFLYSAEFPLFEYRDTPRKAPGSRNAFSQCLSALRLIKNLVLANLAFLFRVRPLLRRGYLVLIDRYYYNYRLDPDSVNYAGPDWLLNLLLPLFPGPDTVITLDADADTLLSRKQELSRDQIARQIAIKDSLDFGDAKCVRVDAKQPAAEIAAQTLAALSAQPEERRMTPAPVRG